METPLITILLTTYNRSHLIRETLDSVIAQTYKNWECFIIDDNSTDGTEEYLKKNYIQKDSRFSYFKKDLKRYKQGLGGSRNMGLDLSKEKKYIHFFDDDDLMHEKKVELQVDLLIQDNSLDFVTCEYGHLNIEDINLKDLKSSGLPLMSEKLVYDFLTRNKSKINLNSCGPIWKRSFWADHRFHEELKTAEEYVAYCKLFLSKKNIKYDAVSKLLFFYRKHIESNTASRYEKFQIIHSMDLADKLVCESIFSNNQESYSLLSYYIKKHIIISFNYDWYKIFDNFFLKSNFKGKRVLLFKTKLFIMVRKIFIKLL